MAELGKEWSNALYGFKTEEDVIEFIFERLDTSDFEDSFTPMTKAKEPNEHMKYGDDEKREALYDFMIDLVKRANVKRGCGRRRNHIRKWVSVLSNYKKSWRKYIKLSVKQ